MWSLSVLSQPFQSRDFGRLWSATVVSNLGSLIQLVGLSWTIALISDSDRVVAFVQTAATLPIVLFSIAAGALADNWDRRRLMLGAQGLMFVASACLAVVSWLGLLTPTFGLGLTFVIGCGTALYNPSWQASVGDLVPRPDIPAAVTLNGLAFNLMRSVGPVAGGFVVAVAGATTAFALNAVSYVPLIAMLLRLKRLESNRTLPREAFAGAVMAGLRYVFMSQGHLIIVARAFLLGFGVSAILALLPLVARDLLSGTAITYGFLLGSFGAGALLGAAASAWLRARLENELLARLVGIGVAVSSAMLALTDETILACFFLIPAGALWLLGLTSLNMTIQLSTPKWVLGRALAIYQTAVFGGIALGSWLWGVLAELHSIDIALMASSVVLLVGAGAGLLFPLPRLDMLDLDPWAEPDLEPPADETQKLHGPVVVLADYEIAEEDTGTFLSLMVRRRRIRLRDGARNWNLMRDMRNRRLWTETYQLPSWLDYIRHRSRHTRSDAEVSDALHRLHRGQVPQRRHMLLQHMTPRPDINLFGPDPQA